MRINDYGLSFYVETKTRNWMSQIVSFKPFLEKNFFALLIVEDCFIELRINSVPVFNLDLYYREDGESFLDFEIYEDDFKGIKDMVFQITLEDFMFKEETDTKTLRDFIEFVLENELMSENICNRIREELRKE